MRNDETECAKLLDEAVALLTAQGVGIPATRGEYGWKDDTDWIERRDALIRKFAELEAR